MADRCCLTLTYAEKDQPVVAHYLDAEDERVENGSVTASYHNVNYGGDHELSQLASRGVPYYGHHDAGAEYGAHIVACDGECADSWATGTLDGTLAVDIALESGGRTGAAIDDANRFRELWLRARAAVRRRAAGIEASAKGEG